MICFTHVNLPRASSRHPKLSLRRSTLPSIVPRGPSRGPKEMVHRQARTRRPGLRGSLRDVALPLASVRTPPQRIAIREGVSARAHSPVGSGPAGCPADPNPYLNSHRSRCSASAPASLRESTSGSKPRGCHASGGIVIVCFAAPSAWVLPPQQPALDPRRPCGFLTDLHMLRRTRRNSRSARRPAPDLSVAHPTHTTRRLALPMPSHPTCSTLTREP